MMSTIARRLRPERSVSAIIAATRGTAPNHVMSPAGTWRPAAAPVKLAPFAVGGTRAGSGMPQLDMFTYMSQYTWLVVFFFGYYLVMFNNGLPALARILKTRRILMEETKAASGQGKSYPDADVAALHEATKTSVEYLYNSVNGASKWCNDVVKTLQASQLDGVNKAYLSSLGEVTLSQVMKAKALDAISPSTLHAAALADVQPAVHPKAFILRAQRSILGGSKGKRGRRA